MKWNKTFSKIWMNINTVTVIRRLLSCLVPPTYTYVEREKVCKCCAVRPWQSIRSQTDEWTHRCCTLLCLLGRLAVAGLLIERWQPFNRLLNLASNAHPPIALLCLSVKTLFDLPDKTQAHIRVGIKAIYREKPMFVLWHSLNKHHEHVLGLHDIGGENRYDNISNFFLGEI